ncbi:Spo11/DNA topoisomerase VI, subunit A, N-terminal [Dillenia turbinata]|uniref:DNA topoisomerase (ATP-hydrolyzing) n=1 Tax=Dillenia turbinata TaxID=194707 RepID=A0AAN8VMS2_9MAGN
MGGLVCKCSHCNLDVPKGKELLTLEKETQAYRLNVLLRVLLIVQQLLEENRHGSKRDIYYMHPSLFSEQSLVDRAINDICIILQCSRHNINVVSVGNGLVMGWLRYSEDERIFDCMKAPNSVYPVPVHVEDIKGIQMTKEQFTYTFLQKICLEHLGKALFSFSTKLWNWMKKYLLGCLVPKRKAAFNIVSVAQYILVVEKESVFQRLADDQFCNANRCIVVTGKGYPDIPTRRQEFLFLQLLIKELSLPIYCLVDCDPYGFDILTTYRFGSMQMAFDVKHLCVPEMRWLGAFSSDSEKFNLPQQCLLPLTAEGMERLADKRRTESMLWRCYLQREAPHWRFELELMLQRGVKFEIEALSVHSISFLSEEYIPSKIKGVNPRLILPNLRLLDLEGWVRVCKPALQYKSTGYPLDS